MNPNDSTQNNNTNVQNTSNNASSPFVNPTPVGYVQPQPVNIEPVTSSPVSQTPVVQVTQPQVNNTNTVSVQTQPPVQIAQSEVVSQAKPVENPNATIPPINLTNTTTNIPEPTVINTTKSKGSNIVLIFVIILLVAFVFNIDKMSEYYQNYIETGSLKPANVPTDNLSNGYILINQSESSMNVLNIRFYNFDKKGDNKISFNYSSTSNYDDITKENIYVGIYNSEKELLYKELFNPNKAVEIAVSSYTMNLTSDIYDNAFYALVKNLSTTELNAASKLKCTYSDKNYKYENVYHFKNEMLDSYDISKQSITDESKLDLENEYNELKDKINVGYENNTIKYSIDLNEDNTNITTIYEKGVTPTIIKNSETEKKWNCE